MITSDQWKYSLLTAALFIAVIYGGIALDKLSDVVRELGAIRAALHHANDKEE
jgi:hypothetical protein